MNLRLLAAALTLAAAPVAFAADDENPYKKAKVGDFSTYKMTTKVPGGSVEGTMTQEVTAKDDKEATVRTSGKVSGTDIPPNDVKIDLTKPYDPTKATGPLPPGANVQVEKLKDGKEKIKVAGKEYDATWETYKMKITSGGMSFDAEMKVWQSKELAIPILKMEMTGEVQGMKMEVAMELTETGTKPAGTTPEKK
jgi:hypothetical protein